VLSKVFSTSNITGPIKFLMRLILGTDFSAKSPNLAHKMQNIEALEKIWESSSGGNKISLPRKIFGMSARLFFSIVALAASVLV
jgi:hypothetical protein